MPISKLNLEEIIGDERISEDARLLLFAIFDHQQGEAPQPLWEPLRRALQELQAAGYVMRGDGWKMQAGGHYLFFDRSQAPTVAGTLPPLPPRTFGRDVLYVIGQPGTAIVKIGVTSSLPSRLKSIQTGSPVPLRVLWWHPGSYDLESQLHRQFDDCRLHGEWFDFGVEEPEVIVELAVAQLRPEEFPPPIGAREGFDEYFRKFPPEGRYSFLLSGLPPGPFRHPRQPASPGLADEIPPLI